MTTDIEDEKRQNELLGHLMTVNTGMGNAIQRMLDHKAEHGRVPNGELRELGGLLAELAMRVIEEADRLDQTVIDSGGVS